MAISNKYKNTLDNFINNSDTKSLDWPGLIDKGSHNMPKSKSSLTIFLEEYCLDKDISITLLEPIPNI